MKGKVGKADIIFKNGDIWTANRSQPYAHAVAIREDRFCFVSASANDPYLEALIGPKTKVVDLGGSFCMPAVVDSHMHFTCTARSSWYFILNKEQVSSLDAMRQALREYVQTHTKEEVPYIYAESCPTELMDESGIKKEFLDEICSDRPVLLCDANFHRSLVNSRMLELMDINAETCKDLNSIKSYELDEAGEPTGIVNERAFEASLDLMYDRIGWQPPAQDDPAVIEPLMKQMNRWGIQTVLDGFTEGEETFIGLRELEKQGKLSMYYEGAVLVENREDLDRAVETLKKWRGKYAGRHIDIHNLKLFLDGTNEIGTSAVLEPFINDPEGEDCGTLGFSEEELYEIFMRANAEGLDVQIHLVGDRAFRTAIDAAERAKADCGDDWDCRINLLHCELTHPADRMRIRPLGIYINMTPHWSCGGFGTAALQFLGRERFNSMYSFKDMMNDGAMISCSSDAVDMEELERINPFVGIEIGHTRFDEGCGYGKVREPEDEKLPVEELLKGYTINGAKALRLDGDLGSIETDKVANMIVLNQNPLTVPAEMISRTKVKIAVFDGTMTEY